MARKVSVRVVVNRAALKAFAAGVADGMEDIGERFKEVIRVPDAPPFGQGLILTPDYAVFAGTKKVAGGGTRPRTVRLIRSAVTLVAGEGFPGRFVELSTIDTAPQPHVTPAMNELLPGAEGYIKPKVRERLARVR